MKGKPHAKTNQLILPFSPLDQAINLSLHGTDGSSGKRNAIQHAASGQHASPSGILARREFSSLSRLRNKQRETWFLDYDPRDDRPA